MGLYRKKPVVVAAYRLAEDNFEEIGEWCGGQFAEGAPDWLGRGRGMDIPTLEGIMAAYIGDWIIQGIEGEFYPCASSIFEKTYEAV